MKPIKTKLLHYILNQKELEEFKRNKENYVIIHKGSFYESYDTNNFYPTENMLKDPFHTYKKFNHVYFLPILGHEKFRIALNFWQNQKFLWMQRKHWFQKEENIRYIINILFLLAGLILGILAI